MPPSPAVFHPSPVIRRDISESEAASLGGKPAKTPIIAGAICGSVLFIAWVVGAIIYIRKRTKRKKLKELAAAGLVEPPPEKIVLSGERSERYVMPPDPAVILGIAKPGEIAHPKAAESETISLKASRRPSPGKSPRPSGEVPRAASVPRGLSHSSNRSAQEPTSPSRT